MTWAGGVAVAQQALSSNPSHTHIHSSSKRGLYLSTGNSQFYIDEPHDVKGFSSSMICMRK
jgi:hypothetical protein